MQKVPVIGYNYYTNLIFFTTTTTILLHLQVLTYTSIELCYHSSDVEIRWKVLIFFLCHFFIIVNVTKFVTYLLVDLITLYTTSTTRLCFVSSNCLFFPFGF